MDPKTKNDFGIRIKERRETLGISQAELARRVGYTSRSMITKIEKCESDVARDKRRQIPWRHGWGYHS